MADLASCPKCGVRLPADAPEGVCPACELRGALEADASQPPLPPLEDSGEELPRRFADYELLQEVARGGMGIVYRARQVSLDRIVAVKLLPFGGPTSAAFIKRFRAEASAAAALRHPNIVAVHEVGVLHGQHYLVMDFVNGPPLSRLIAQGPLPARQAVTHLKTIAEAIHHAHERGILHRDLKPSNVLIDEDGQPLVTDFGLAKRIDGESSLTLPGQVLGSPNYMPPEQASSEHGTVTRRSDVYGLGAMLYHALTGRPPFQAATLSESIHQVLNLEPVSPRLLNPTVPRDLETICLKCLEKEPGRRYPTARALADELDRFLKSEPIQARPIGALGRTWRWCRRKPALATVGTVATLLLLTLAIGGPIVAAHERVTAEKYRRSLYASDLNVAYQAWQRADLQQAVEALDRHTNDWQEFTWRYVNRLCQPYRQPFLKASNAVHFAAASKDGRFLAASGGFDFVTVWDLKARTNLPLREFRAGGILAGPVCFSPDGRYLVTGGLSAVRNTNGLQIWDTRTWQRVINFANLPAKYCDFSPDGKRLAVPSGTNVALLKVGGNWPELRRLTNHTSYVWSARFSTNGARLVTASSDSRAIVWDTRTWQPIATLPHTDRVLLAIFSPDGQQVATMSGNTVSLWDVDSEQRLDGYSHQAGVFGLDFSPDGRWVASGGEDGLVKLWDWKANTLRELRGHTRMVYPVKFVLGGTRLASGSWDGMIRLWDIGEIETSPHEILAGQTSQAPPELTTPIAFSPDGSMVATVSRDAAEILLWDAVSGTSAGTLDAVGKDGAFLSADLAFWPRAEILAAARICPGPQPVKGRPRVIQFWDFRHRIITNSFPGQAPICFSRNARWFACQGTNEGTIQFRDLETGRSWTSQGGFEPSTDKNEFAFSPDGKWLASSGIETVLWETATGHRAATVVSAISDLEEPISSVAFTPDSRWLIGAGATGEIQIWDVATSRRVDRFHAHIADITCLAVAPDRKTLATGDDAGKIKLWRLEPPEKQFSSRWIIRELLTLAEHHAGIVSLRFSPKGDILGSSDRDGIVRLWRADPVP